MYGTFLYLQVFQDQVFLYFIQIISVQALNISNIEFVQSLFSYFLLKRVAVINSSCGALKTIKIKAKIDLMLNLCTDTNNGFLQFCIRVWLVQKIAQKFNEYGRAYLKFWRFVYGCSLNKNGNRMNRKSSADKNKCMVNVSCLPSLSSQ